MRLRGWWLVTAAAVITAVLTALGKIYTGAVVAGAVAAAGAIVAVIAERGRAQIADRAKSQPRGLYVSRVDKLDDPIRLGVHPAASLEHEDGHADQVPRFVPRDRLPELEAALRAGGFVLVVGDSTAGKSRLAFEAMRRCLPRLTFVWPEDPTAVAAAVVTAKQKRPSVLWLDDLEKYLGADGLTRAHLDDLGDKVVVLATLRAHLRDELSARHDFGRPQDDRLNMRAGREVFHAVTKEIRLDRIWSPTELSAARESPDPRVKEALGATDRHGVAETMAAGPALLQSWRDAGSAGRRPADGVHGDPRGAALVSAAVDIRRAGCHRPLDLDFLRQLHETYLAERGGRSLYPGTWENAVKWATRQLHATSSLIDPETCQAFDYLVNETAEDPAAPAIPEATWRMLMQRLEPDDVVEVAWRASYAGFVQHIEPAQRRALASGHYHAAADLAEILDFAGQSQAPALLELTISQAEGKDGVSAEDILDMRHNLAWMLGELVSGQGDPERALGIVRRVVADGEQLLGRTHQKVLRAKLTEARQVGALGNPHEALAIVTEVADLSGEDVLLTLSARFEAAVWTWEVDGSAAAAKVFGELLEYAQSVGLGSDGFLVDTAWNLGSALVSSGDVTAGLSRLEQVVRESEQIYGRKHAQTFRYRHTHANAVGNTGDPRTALELTRDVVTDAEQTFGAMDLTTLQAKRYLAHWTAKTGDQAAAIELYQNVLADGVRLVGDDHWLVTEVRAGLAKLRSA